MQKAIVDRVRKAVLDATSEGKSAFVQYVEKGKVKEGFAENSPFDLDSIRKSTNLASAGYESIVSRGGLKSLGDSFSWLATSAKVSIEEAALAEAAAGILGSDGIYDAFRSHIEDTYGIGKTAGPPNSTGFRYRKAKESDVKIGTSIADSSEDFISFKNLNHGDLKTNFVKFLKDKGVTDNKELLDFITKNLDGGHLTGVFNIKVRNVFNLTVTQRDVADYRTLRATSGIDEELNDIFTKMMLLLADADYLSSNIVRNIELFSTTSKRVYSRNSPQVSVELQLRVKNGEAGSKLTGLGAALNKLVKAADRVKSRVDGEGAKKALESALKNFASVAEYVQQVGKSLDTEKLSDTARLKVEEILRDAKSAETFFTTKGSDSFKDSVAKTILAILNGKPVPKLQQSKATNKATIKLPTRGKPKKLVIPRPSNKPTVNRPNVATTKVVPENSVLTSLQTLLDISLYEKIKQNMGTGNSKRVLNFRTGRLASSAKVERLTMSREGMVTAFYSYMKNPYATFSEGGLQQYPKTRDPKLLISKSIRELAATLAVTRMRAVLV